MLHLRTQDESGKGLSEVPAQGESTLSRNEILMHLQDAWREGDEEEGEVIMGNMGYCRFQNTASDLRDCQDYIFDDDLSPDEDRARKRLIKICKEIAADFNEEEED
jgi:hypothetical protein